MGEHSEGGLIPFYYMNRLIEDLSERDSEDDFTDLLLWNIHL